MPLVVIGEIIFSAPRNKDYEDFPLQQATAKTKDGVVIVFWFSNNSENLVIMIHGHNDNAGILFKRAKGLIQNQPYDSYLDLRNHGKSGEKLLVSFVVCKSRDVVAELIGQFRRIAKKRNLRHFHQN